MSTLCYIKNKSDIWIFLYALLTIAVCISSCSGLQTGNESVEKGHREQIRSVIYSNAGGALGWSEVLEIRPDSVLYNTLLAARHNQQTAFAQKNTLQQWDELTGNLDLEAIRKVVSGASQQPVDGTDQTYTIITDKGSYRFMNPDFKTHPDTTLEKWVRAVGRLAGTYYEKAR